VTGKNSHIKSGLRVGIAMVALAAAFVLPTQALAQTNCANADSDPTAAQYCTLGEVQNGGGGPEVEGVSTSAAPSSGTDAVETSSSGSLPFTGLDVGILLLVAVVLTGTGLTLRRLTAPGAPRS
jgi:hypothetical protein